VTALEIAVTSPAGARIALAGGADRVELCVALELGGVTPSQALVEAAVAAGLPVHVLVRCRPGDFRYDADEIALMTAEVRSVLAAGAAGVVVGALTGSGSLDTAAIRRWADAAGTAEVTLHRAIDRSADPVAAAAVAAELGLTRILTSGGAATAGAGVATIERMAAAAPGIQVMAGGGVRTADIPALVAAGAAAVHLSAKRAASPRDAGPATSESRDALAPLASPRDAGPAVPMGSADDDTHLVTDPAVVAAARTALAATTG
jgi:copper homeostasis protein